MQRDPGALMPAVLDAIPLEIAVLAPDGTITAVNAAWRRLAESAGVAADARAIAGANYLGVCERAMNAGCEEAAAVHAGIRAVLNGETATFTAVYDMSHSGAERCYEVRVVPGAGGAVVTHTDVTARVRAERQVAERTNELMHLSRALTAGTLSGAMAHELNQPLTAILANAQAALRMLDAREPDVPALREMFCDAIRSVQRASEIVSRTRNLLTRDAPRRQEVDINEVVQEAMRMLMNEALLRGVRLTVLRALDLPPVVGDPIQLQQCVMNLALNGFDAMDDMPRSERHLLVHTARAARNSAEIVIEDRGSGIDPAPLQHIFDPFFTTKPNGMGMGLYITREIVRIHGGRITAKRNADRGMRFRIVLPNATVAGERTSGLSAP